MQLGSTIESMIRTAGGPVTLYRSASSIDPATNLPTSEPDEEWPAVAAFVGMVGAEMVDGRSVLVTDEIVEFGAMTLKGLGVEPRVDDVIQRSDGLRYLLVKKLGTTRVSGQDVRHRFVARGTTE